MLIQGTLRKQANQIKLICSLGQFAINDPQLNGLSDGEHNGFFELVQITACMQQSVNDQGLPTLTLESVAELKSYAFLAIKLPENIANKSVLHQTAQQKETSEHDLESELGDKELFGELWPLGDKVKLDESHPKFREQVKRMGEFRARKIYTYIGEDKVWLRLHQSTVM